MKLYKISYILPLLVTVCLVPLMGSIATQAKEAPKAKTEKAKPSGDITTRRSDNDKNLDKLKDKLYPEDKLQQKEKSEKPDKKISNQNTPKSPDNKTIVKSLINMKPDEIEKVKQNQISRIRTDLSIEKKEKKKLISETARFYDTLKKLPTEERESFVSNFNK